VPALPASTRPGPLLRIEQLTIRNFRTFRERTVIPFRGGAPAADSIATFHGDNGSGKSNALAALDLFFAVVPYFLIMGASLGERWDTPFGFLGPEQRKLVVSYRDRPAGAEGPTEITAVFEDERLGSLAIRFTPSGDRVTSELLTGELGEPIEKVTPELRSQLLNGIQTPFGPGSRPLAILDARRRASWLSHEPHGHNRAALVEELFNLRTSLRIDLRERWRAFVRMLERFPVFQGKEISVDRIAANASPELLFEERGRAVLKLDELSSGEQQIVLLCAAILVANAAVVAIEEPELSLDLKNTQLLKDILQSQIEAGLADQIILESHVPSFDGPSVIRFQRDPAGATLVSRELVASEGAIELAKRAKEQGAKQRWVTGDGYTELPEAMRRDLDVGAGKHVWFLKGPEHWEAWPEEDLDGILGGGGSEGGDG
jgi:hypothetical protein